MSFGSVPSPHSFARYTARPFLSLISETCSARYAGSRLRRVRKEMTWREWTAWVSDMSSLPSLSRLTLGACRSLWSSFLLPSVTPHSVRDAGVTRDVRPEIRTAEGTEGWSEKRPNEVSRIWWAVSRVSLSLAITAHHIRSLLGSFPPFPYPSSHLRFDPGRECSERNRKRTGGGGKG